MGRFYFPGSKWIFILIAVCIASTAAVVAAGISLNVVYGLLALAAVLLALLFRSVILPKEMVMKGMRLIASQDFNNRLSKVGDSDADRIVDLFNMMIDKLRGERLRNMERESFLNLLIDASPMGVAILDFDRNISMVNSAWLKILGISSEEEIVGKRLEDVNASLVPEMLLVPKGESRVVRCGDVRMFRCYHLGFVQTGFNREFYLLESLTEEVMKAEKAAYEKVIRIISHEVNNTMAGVQSVLETVSESTDEPEIRLVTESCNRRCVEMCRFISSYADVVRVPEPMLGDYDPSVELEKMLPFLREIAGRNTKLEFIPAERPLTVKADSSLMSQVIVNIVKNAAESIKGSDGHILLRVVDTPEGVTLDIVNNGDPISDEVSRQLFSPFFTTKKEGRGLGLTLVSEILNRHKCRFSLRTVSKGETRFRIIFV